MKPVFPYFGGKSRVASVVWAALGDVDHYVEPFAGSLAVLLARPDSHVRKIETINDTDCLVANFWRASQHDPQGVAKWAKQPNFEVDLLARHRWLIGKRASLQELLTGDHDACDVQAAGLWVWGICAWFSAGFSSESHASASMHLPILGQIGRGVLSAATRDDLSSVFSQLCDRLKNVRVACGDWERVVGSTACVTATQRTHGVFLDPPYPDQKRESVYACENFDSARIEKWCREWESKTKIVLAGYEGNFSLPGWSVHRWKASEGFARIGNVKGNGTENAHRECLWISPMCNDISECQQAFLEK